jgi:hypothetical protein
MPGGTGYIRSWEIGDFGGLIQVCAGDNLVDQAVGFAFSDCDGNLQQILSTKSISMGASCKPQPAGALRVSFDFDIIGGLDAAVNVSRL